MTSAWRIMQRRMVDVLAGVTGLLAGVFSVLFLFSSTFGGFRLETPWGILSCREMDKLLWDTVLFGAAWTGLWVARRRMGGKGAPEAAARPDTLSRGEARWVGVLLVVVNLLVWLRFLYRAHEKYVVNFTRHPSIAFWQIHLLSSAVLVGCLFLWSRLRKTHGAVAAFISAAVFALSPMAFYVCDTTAGLYAVVTAVWIVLSFVPRLRFSAGGRWLAIAAIAGFLAAVGSMLHGAGLGWGGARIWTQLTRRTLPNLLWVPAVVGLVAALRLDRRASGLLRAAIWPALVGVVFAGSREVAGDLGGLFLLPAGTVLAGIGAGYLFNSSLFSRTVLGRNLVVVLLLGMLLGAAKSGVDRGARGPAYVPKPDPGSLFGEDGR